MVSFGEKAKIKKAGNLNQGRSYVITTVGIFYVHMYFFSIIVGGEWKSQTSAL
jgi:hypothetical protein